MGTLETRRGERCEQPANELRKLLPVLLGSRVEEEDKKERKPPRREAPSAGMARGMRLRPKEKTSVILIITATHSALTGHYTTRLEPSLQACHPVFINRDCRAIQGCPAVRSCAGPQTQGCWSPEFMLILFCVLYTYYRGESWTIKNVEHRKIDAFELWYWRRFLKVPWTSGNQAVNPKGNQP